MAFHVLHPELARFLLEGEQDEIAGPNAARIEKIKSMRCPRCSASLHPQLNPYQHFTPGEPLARLLATCECGVEIDTDTGIVIDRGSATKVEDPFPLLRKDEG